MGNVGVGDLDRLRFEQEYLPALVAHDVLAANERSYEQKLAAAKLVINDTEPVPTVLGLLVIGRSPADWLSGAYAQFLRLAGNDLTAPVVDEEAIHGTVADQIRRLEEKLEAHNLRGVRFADRHLEARSEAYPMDALRQLVRNAFMHRSYEATNAPVRVYWFDDRIEIHNPGGPFGSVTPENFGQPGVTDYRNPNLAEALRALGYVQRFGAGIAIARKALGKRLVFEVQRASWPPLSAVFQDDQHRVLQQRGRGRKDIARLSHGLDVRAARAPGAGGRSRPAIESLDHGTGGRATGGAVAG